MYLIHPALDTFIRAQRMRRPFLQYQHVPVGENLVWEPYFPTLMQIEKHLHAIDDHRFVDLSHQIVKRVQSLLNSGKQPFARVEIETGSEWKSLFEQQESDERAGTLLWLEELVTEL